MSCLKYDLIAARETYHSADLNMGLIPKKHPSDPTKWSKAKSKGKKITKLSADHINEYPVKFQVK